MQLSLTDKKKGALGSHLAKNIHEEVMELSWEPDQCDPRGL